MPKQVTVDALRDSFATYLLEGSTDIQRIQDLLGRKSSKTTQIYTHVSERNIAAIRSPLDEIMSLKTDQGDGWDSCSPL